ncbi:hypothetical protein KHC33_11505 [Methanospirillum sp. J.3.6.1-F.2.7.3]|uniref:Histidine kinase N-terminal 7TM region domain-containing protein n=2 Tax=Methanospirillum TaxID=2202 RepID=A0A8E7EIW8_9EURY|nr:MULTISPECIES: histidine kinase N-terminal 7TM domain-containing protein [Methanospirillum]MDX8551555.1 histidine kinase N-terminal 7TM domain-containing protein [Methanospirillum hungatei]QVV87961.1 hypothetical protein KHC33_11505 [Methanospirillum sp. J.3.6.1-F.2.7.3]QXO95434.1 hypothetical protein KSK55_03260 [Methanospirillum hungatei]
MTEEIGAEASLLFVGIILLISTIFLYIFTGKPRLRFLLILNISLLFWIVSYGMNLATSGPQMTGTWQIISLMGLTMVVLSFIAAFVDYMKKEE